MSKLNLEFSTLVSLFETSISEQDKDQFKQLLSFAVADLLKTTSTLKLMQQFYRLDLNEFAVTKALNLTDVQLKVDTITQLILNRVIQKIATRKSSHKG